MTVGSNGQIYLLGGYDPVAKRELSSIDTLDPVKGICAHVGDLKFKDCSNLACCLAESEKKILVCGAWNDLGKHTIQVFDEHRKAVTTVIALPFEWPSYIYGVVLTQGFLFVISGGYTVVCGLDDVINGKTHSLRMCKNYQAPNYWSGVTLSECKNYILLIGGEPRSRISRPCYVFLASVKDVMEDSKTGWQPLNTDKWTLGDYAIRGCDIGDVKISS